MERTLGATFYERPVCLRTSQWAPSATAAASAQTQLGSQGDDLRSTVTIVAAGSERLFTSAAVVLSPWATRAMRLSRSGSGRESSSAMPPRSHAKSKRVGGVSWPGKATVTFSDALSAVRRWLWAEAVLPQAGGDAVLKKLPDPLRELLLTAVAPAA